MAGSHQGGQKMNAIGENALAESDILGHSGNYIHGEALTPFAHLAPTPGDSSTLAKIKKMVGLPAISNSLQEIAVYGVKEEKRELGSYGEWFHLLIFLAWQGWNISLEGEDKILPNLTKEFMRGRKRFGIKIKEIEENFISTDVIEVARLFSKIKEKKYPFDRRFIHAIESTPEGSLRVYSE